MKPIAGTPTPYLANLNPLRGIAAIFTIIFHIDLMVGGGGGLLLKFKDSFLISKFYLMVDFFFILSGFIMSHVYQKWFRERVAKVSFRQFSIARFARVYPLHLFTLLYLIGLRFWFLHTGAPDDPFSEASDSWQKVITNLLLVQSMNLHNWFSWNNAAWSISTEWWMYMLFPFLVRPFLRLRGAGRAIIVAGCIAGYLLIMFYLQRYVTIVPTLSFIKPPVPVTTLDISYQFGFFRCLFGFVLGMITYLGYQDGWMKKLLGNGITFCAFAAGFFLSLHLGWYDVISVSFIPFLILSAAYGSNRMNRFFGSRPMQRIGDWSFSIYMTHQPLMYTILAILSVNAPAQVSQPSPPTQLAGWIICIVFICLTLFISFLTFRFIEIPAREWINKKFRPTHRLPHQVPLAT